MSFKSIKLSISGTSIVVKPTYHMVEGTYDIIAEGTNLLNRSIVKKLNTLFNNNEIL